MCPHTLPHTLILISSYVLWDSASYLRAWPHSSPHILTRRPHNSPRMLMRVLIIYLIFMHVLRPYLMSSWASLYSILYPHADSHTPSHFTYPLPLQMTIKRYGLIFIINSSVAFYPPYHAWPHTPDTSYCLHFHIQSSSKLIKFFFFHLKITSSYFFILLIILLILLMLLLILLILFVTLNFNHLYFLLILCVLFHLSILYLHFPSYLLISWPHLYSFFSFCFYTRNSSLYILLTTLHLSLYLLFPHFNHT